MTLHYAPLLSEPAWERCYGEDYRELMPGCQALGALLGYKCDCSLRLLFTSLVSPWVFSSGSACLVPKQARAFLFKFLESWRNKILGISFQDTFLHSTSCRTNSNFRQVSCPFVWLLSSFSTTSQAKFYSLVSDSHPGIACCPITLLRPCFSLGRGVPNFTSSLLGPPARPKNDIGVRQSNRVTGEKPTFLHTHGSPVGKWRPQKWIGLNTYILGWTE